MREATSDISKGFVDVHDANFALLANAREKLSRGVFSRGVQATELHDGLGDFRECCAVVVYGGLKVFHDGTTGQASSFLSGASKRTKPSHGSGN